MFCAEHSIGSDSLCLPQLNLPASNIDFEDEISSLMKTKDVSDANQYYLNIEQQKQKSNSIKIKICTNQNPSVVEVSYDTVTEMLNKQGDWMRIICRSNKDIFHHDIRVQCRYCLSWICQCDKPIGNSTKDTRCHICDHLMLHSNMLSAPIRSRSNQMHQNESDAPSSQVQPICVVFPRFTSIKYSSILDHFVIDIPSHLHSWLSQVLQLIVSADLEQETDAYAWMVLLYPSLLLIQKSFADRKGIELVRKTIGKLCNFMCSEAERKLYSLELNTVLIFVELCTHKTCTNPKIVRLMSQHVNRIMEPTDTFDKFLKISCARAGDIKLTQELLYCTSKDIESRQYYAKTRKKWEAFVGVLTQIVRLHRLLKINENNNNLSQLCKENINKICSVFDEKYCLVLRKLMIPLRQKTEDLKKYYCYYRYKTMAMCTHTATAMPPAFAAYFGKIKLDERVEIDMDLWTIMVDALQFDVDKFLKTVNHLLFMLKTQNRGQIIDQQDVLKRISRLPKTELKDLRILDNICYQSVSLMMMFSSCSASQQSTKIQFYRSKLMNIRAQICQVIKRLSENSLLFRLKISALKNDALQTCFLVDSQDKITWSLHLISGVLLNYWAPKN